MNVQGTVNVVQLAQCTTRLKTLLHVSSTYVAGRASGSLREGPVRFANGWFSAYEQSKFEAEQYICEHANGIPWVIARLSTVVGNSRTGYVSRFNYFHQLLRLVPRYPFPFIPGDPKGLVDVVANDWVTHGLLGILEGEVNAGTVFHFCAGPSQSLPAQEVVEVAFRLHRLIHPASCVVVPSFVGVDQFQTFAEDLRRKGKATLSQIAELLLLCLSHLEVDQSFLNTKTNRFLEQYRIVPPKTREVPPPHH